MTSEFPASWGDPEYVAAVVGVLAVGAVAVALELGDYGVTAGTFVALLLAVCLPTAAAYELARRLR